MRRFLSILLIFSLLFASTSFIPPVQPRIIHVLVALCDNDSQGIVPVPRAIGNGNDPDQNLYWGCGYGVRTFFKKSAEWKCISSVKDPKTHVMERLIFKHNSQNCILVADAYRGARIKQCTQDFFKNASGNFSEQVSFSHNKVTTAIELGDANLVAYVGHDGLMDFSLDGQYPSRKKDLSINKDVMIYACISKTYFYDGVLKSGANPVVWTTGLMCPEAYTLKASIDGWLLGETNLQIKERNAQAYNTYQKCGINGARGLFYAGWKNK